MKKLLFALLLVAIAYGTYKYLETVKNETGKKQDILKPSEKALKQMDKEDGK